MRIHAAIVTVAVLLLVSRLFAAPATPEATEEFFKALGKANVEKVNAMLASDPSLARSQNEEGVSALVMALFGRPGADFLPPKANPAFAAVLAAAPPRDLFELAAAGDEKGVIARFEADPSQVKAVHTFGWTPLHFAAFSGSVPTVQALLVRGADVHARAKNRFRNTPLQVALLVQQTDVARFLIERGADVNVRQAGGFAPLHEAALLGNKEIVALLLDNGAEVNARTNDGETPLQSALRRKQTAAADLLRGRGAKE